LPKAAIVAAAACCGVAAHFANTLPDVAADTQTGVRGLPQRLGPRASTLITVGLIATASVLLLVATEGAGLAIAAAVIDVGAAVVVAARARDGAQAFRLLIAAVAVLVITFVITGGHNLTG
jgi:4-hydroxybenzoate polyprenyltransferase